MPCGAERGRRRRGADRARSDPTGRRRPRHLAIAGVLNPLRDHPHRQECWGGSRRGSNHRPPLVETLSAGPRLPAWSTAWIVKEVTPAGTVIDCFDPAGAVAGMVGLEKLTL